MSPKTVASSGLVVKINSEFYVVLFQAMIPMDQHKVSIMLEVCNFSLVGRLTFFPHI